MVDTMLRGDVKHIFRKTIDKRMFSFKKTEYF